MRRRQIGKVFVQKKHTKVCVERFAGKEESVMLSFFVDAITVLKQLFSLKLSLESTLNREYRIHVQFSRVQLPLPNV